MKIKWATVGFSAVWYDQTSYPTSWQLDPTEGPNRERRRLQRCYLTIPNKYLLKDRRKCEGDTTASLFRILVEVKKKKSSRLEPSRCLAADTTKTALSFLFEDKTHSSFSSTVKDKATSEPIRYLLLSL